MRLKAELKSHPEYKKVVIHDTSAGAYLFCYTSLADSSCTGDSWFATFEEAKSCVEADFGIVPTDWIDIGDPLPGAQHDCEEPMVAVRDETGTVTLVPWDEEFTNRVTCREPGIEEVVSKVNGDTLLEIQRLLAAGSPIAAIQLYHKKADADLVYSKQAINLISELSSKQD
jgi:hypothetical protein